VRLRTLVDRNQRGLQCSSWGSLPNKPTSRRLSHFLHLYVILARILTREEIGQVGLLTAALAFFNTLTLLALPATATRFISRNIGSLQPRAAGAVAHRTLLITLSIAIPSTLATILLASFFSKFLFGSQDFTLLLAATAISGLLFDLILLYGGYFLGAGDFASQVYQSILYFALSRGSGLVLAILGLRVLGIVFGWIVGGTATLLLSLYRWRGKLTNGKTYPVKPLLVFTVPLFISSLITLAQQWGAILATTLQAMGKTNKLLQITAVATALDLAIGPHLQQN